MKVWYTMVAMWAIGILGFVLGALIDHVGWWALAAPAPAFFSSILMGVMMLARRRAVYRLARRLMIRRFKDEPWHDFVSRVTLRSMAASLYSQKDGTQWLRHN